MLYQFARVVSLAQPLWWLLENVPRAPAVEIAGYNTQRLEMSAWEFGLDQSRRRHFQFGSHSSRPLVVPRPLTTPPPLQPAVTASENRRTHKRPYAAFCGLMGFPPIDLPPFKSSARYQAVGNGVPFPIALAIAHAIAEFWREVPSLFPGINIPAQSQQACPCGCGRPISGDQLSATPACRKRLQRQRHGIYPGQSHSQQPH
jgi:DNA (cytosine-5)-methyltransferase 1